jgi:hypothetical protein
MGCGTLIHSLPLRGLYSWKRFYSFPFNVATEKWSSPIIDGSGYGKWGVYGISCLTKQYFPRREGLETVHKAVTFVWMYPSLSRIPILILESIKDPSPHRDHYKYLTPSKAHSIDWTIATRTFPCSYFVFLNGKAKPFD